MKLIVLGSGTAVPHPRRSSSGYWIETDSSTILLDCSASAIDRAARENLDWANLDAIWISHFHLDHIGGLFPFLFGTRNAPEMRERTKPLRIFGAKGLRTLIENVNDANDYKLLKQPFPLEIIEVESLENFEIAPQISAVTLNTPHTAESLALRLKDERGATLVYTSDTGFDKALRSFAREADLLLMECSFFKDKPTETHLELQEAMYLIEQAKPKKAVLTHFYVEWDAVDFEKEVATFSPPCEVIQACDGLRLDF